MVKFQEATARLFQDIFVCRKCKAKIRASNLKIIAGKIKCRKCNSKALRPVRRK